MYCVETLYDSYKQREPVHIWLISRSMTSEESFIVDDFEDLMATGEVARLVHLPEGTLRYYRHVGKGPRGLKIGRRVLYRKVDVLSWLAEHLEPEVEVHA